MDITGITFDQMTVIVARVSADYDGNLTLHHDAKPLTSRSFRGRIVGVKSDGPGTRRSWSGRRGPWACWHAYRDVMLAVFAENQNARIRTSLADYKGEADFLEKYPATAYKNIGSMMAPAYMPELCDC